MTDEAEERREATGRWSNLRACWSGGGREVGGGVTDGEQESAAAPEQNRGATAASRRERKGNPSLILDGVK
jgi:hypothetical protein